MSYQALAFFDLDGTLLDEHSKITPEIASAMAQLRQNKILPIIATGRTEVEIDEIKKAAGITSNIVMNGSFIRIDGKEIYSDKMSPTICQKMYDMVQESEDELSYYNHSGYWCTGYNEELKGAYQYVHSPLPEIEPLFFKENPVNMMLVLGTKNEEKYRQAFPELTFYRNTPYSIDVVKHGIHKGTGIQVLIERLNLKDVPTYGFGDGANDLALLDACDYKIAMGNAIPQLKEMADFVTFAHTDGGIVHALKHFDLI